MNELFFQIILLYIHTNYFSYLETQLPIISNHQLMEAEWRIDVPVNSAIIVSDNVLTPVRWHIITLAKAGALSSWSLWKYFSEISFKNKTFIKEY